MYPRDLGFWMPAEWNTHQRTFISWPVQSSMVYPGDYHAVCRGYGQIVDAVAEFEPVTVLVDPGDRDLVKNFISALDITFLEIKHNDSWLRDNGPTFVVNQAGDVAGINWRFNAWGGKYQPWDLDDLVAPALLEHLQLRRFDAPLVMEGGSIHVDGQGTLLTTEECLLNPNRNPHLSRAEIEACLGRYLGIEKVIWLKRGLSGDETDGHVDNVAAFAAPGRILLQVCDDPAQENFVITCENMEILERAQDARGRRLEIITVPQPPVQSYKGISLTLSYLNFYFVNGGIILPVFGGSAAETDRQALEVMQGTFPERRIAAVDGMAIIREGGNVHCMTQQMPAALRNGAD
ncbi:MAG: agmatine deiminase family protein [Syntrophomonadaceae bacterium]|nr:agmatine deiminase family protein [Syntrophomonadaceae bacterium]